MTEPTTAELIRLGEILAKVDTCADCGGYIEDHHAGEGSCPFRPRPELRFRRIYAAYAIKFGWPFCDDGRPVVVDSKEAWTRWAAPEEKYSL